MAALHQELTREAEKLWPTIQWCRCQHEQGLLFDYDLLGVYVLLYLGFRKPRSWCGGRLPSTMSSQYNIPVNEIPLSNQVGEVPGLLDTIGGVDYLNLKMGIHHHQNVSILEIFNVLKLNGIKKNNDHFVNRCLLLWACRDRRCCLRLMFRIPTPMEVMRQQAQGERVVTVFTSITELSRHHTAMLHYMDGGQLHSRDPFEFTLHDLTHMNKFGMDADTYHEQVGFFKCICNLSKVKHFFVSICGYDEQLWRELEYVFSDMNCYATHLLQYLLAKMVLATERLVLSLNTASTTMMPLNSPTTTDTTTSTMLPNPGTTTLDKERNYGCMSDTKDGSVMRELPGGDGCPKPSPNPSPNPTLSIKGTKILLVERWKMLLVAMGMKGEPLNRPSSLPSPFSDDHEAGIQQEEEGNEWIDEVEEEQQGDAYAAAMAMIATTFRY